jgi:MIP family channel proteins
MPPSSLAGPRPVEGEEDRDVSLGKQLFAEFIGTFALVFVLSGAVSASALIAGVLGVAIAAGLVLAIMISALGPISGGHFNPAVTVGIWVAGRIQTARAAAYVVVQLAGAVAGAAILRWALPQALWERSNLGLPALNTQLGITTGKGVLIEAVLTFFLVIAVFGVAVDERGTFKAIAGLGIGLVLTFDALVGGPLTGAAMNPAVFFGPAVVTGTWTNFWVYVLGPVSGAVIASAVYWLAFLRTAPPVEGPPPGTMVMDPTAEVEEAPGE